MWPVAWPSLRWPARGRGGELRLPCPPPGPAAFRLPMTRLDRILAHGTRNWGCPRPGDREIKSGEAEKGSSRAPFRPLAPPSPPHRARPVPAPLRWLRPEAHHRPPAPPSRGTGPWAAGPPPLGLRSPPRAGRPRRRPRASWARQAQAGEEARGEGASGGKRAKATRGGRRASGALPSALDSAPSPPLAPSPPPEQTHEKRFFPKDSKSRTSIFYIWNA